MPGDNRPEPLLSVDIDVRDLDGFMLNVERLLASELVAIGTPEECWAALMLWCRAWKQLPAGSLPTDERILASFSGAGKRWSKVRDTALRGFIECSDGRLYHRFLCAEAVRAFERKSAFQVKREADRKRLSHWRERRRENADETQTETSNETRFVAEGQGQGQGQGHRSPDGDLDNSATAIGKTGGDDGRGTRGRRLPEGWEPSGSDREFAESVGIPPSCTTDVVAEFRDYWRGVPGSKGCKLDWSATFRNRCREVAGRYRGHGARRPLPNGQSSGGIVAALDRVKVNYPDEELG